MREMCNITAAQIRAARGLLDWSRETLAEKSGLSLRTLASIEAGEGNPKPETINLICKTLMAAGLLFIKQNGGGPGVRLKRKSS